MITWLILTLIIALILHLIEEIKTGFRRKFPLGEMPLSIFITINFLIYTYCFVTLILSVNGSQLAIPLAWIFALGMLVNAIGHIGIMVIKRNYFPGGITAFLLLPISLYLCYQLIMQ